MPLGALPVQTLLAQAKLGAKERVDATLPQQALDQFRNAWWVVTAAGLIGAIVALGMTPRTRTRRISALVAGEAA